MTRRNVSNRGGIAPVGGIATPAPPLPQGLTLGTPIPVTQVPQFSPTGERPRMYQAVEEALRALPKGQALTVQVPANVDRKRLANSLMNSVRSKIPETRIRSTPEVIYLWIGKVGERSAKKSVAAGGGAQ